MRQSNTDLNKTTIKSTKFDLEGSFITTFNHLINHSNPDKIALAVSGGVDSIALFHLISSWHKSTEQTQKVEIHILHINHNLRLESEQEESFVKNISLRHGYKYFCNHWSNKVSKSSIQESARKFRYDVMSKYCLENNIPILLTGHHRNDAIENYVFRKQRGSGALGLATNFQSYHNDIRVIRPLAWYRKEQLVNYMIALKKDWCEDLSNSDTKYSRNLIRQELSIIDQERISNIELEIKNNDLYCKRIEEKFISAIAETVSIEKYGVGRINLDKFRNLDNEIQIPVLSHVLAIISGHDQIPRYRNIAKILDSICLGKKVDSTIHSCRMFEYGDNLHIYKEVSKISKDPIILKNELMWDNRFQFSIHSTNSPDLSAYTVCMLDKCDLQELKKDNIFLCQLGQIDDFEQKKLIFTFPVIKKVEKVVAIPHIFYYDDDDVRGNLKATFKPRFISRFTHFHNYSKVNINE